MYANWCSNFWCSGWNQFDFIVVFVSVLSMVFPGMPGVSTLRLMRAFRVFRLFKRLPSLNQVVVAIQASIPGVCNAFAILVLIVSTTCRLPAAPTTPHCTALPRAKQMAIYAILAVQFYMDTEVILGGRGKGGGAFLEGHHPHIDFHTKRFAVCVCRADNSPAATHQPPRRPAC